MRPKGPSQNTTTVQGKTRDDKHKTSLAYSLVRVCPLSVCFCLLAEATEGHSGKKALDESSSLSFLCCEALSPTKHELQDCGDVHGNWLLCGLCEWMDLGLFHDAHRDLDMVWGRQYSLDNFELLLQPMEGLYLWFNRRIRLQGNSINACTELWVKCILA